jgi:hypothetical protein
MDAFGHEGRLAMPEPNVRIHYTTTNAAPCQYATQKEKRRRTGVWELNMFEIPTSEVMLTKYMP